MKNRFPTLVIATVAWLASLAQSFAADEKTPPRRPNIVFILADDKYAEVGRHTAVLRIITGFMAETT